ncbi:MAG: phytanoyl-CoA dioxygenase family protein [Acidiferrobacterales bacterium]
MREFDIDKVEEFNENGFLILGRFLEADIVAAVQQRFELLFRGKFETGLYPDEWNWREGRDALDLTRQICNGWKSDYTIASVVLREDIGRLCAQLRGWPGARLNQDNVIWKPPGAKALGFHQDESYEDWIVPREFVTCWIALDDTRADGGTIEYVRGSHKWGLFPPIDQFHAPDVYDREMRDVAAKLRVEPEVVTVEVPAGGCVFHHGRTWHGSQSNRGNQPRRSVVAHCMSSEAKYHPTNVGYIYNRYKRVGSEEMDESFFPILWTADNRRSSFLDEYVRGQGNGD